MVRVDTIVLVLILEVRLQFFTIRRMFAVGLSHTAFVRSLSFWKSLPQPVGRAICAQASGMLTLPPSPAAVPSATMRSIFKRNQEPMVAPATTATPAGPVDNSTESGGAGEGKEDVFAMLKERFFNEIVKLPRECPCAGQAMGVRWLWALLTFGL